MICISLSKGSTINNSCLLFLQYKIKQRMQSSFDSNQTNTEATDKNRQRRIKQEGAREKNNIPNIVKETKGKIDLITQHIFNVQVQSGQPKILQLIIRLFLTKVFRPQKSLSIYKLLDTTIEKKIRSQQKKIDKGERISFHYNNIKVLERIWQIIKIILDDSNGMDDQFILSILWSVFSQKQDEIGMRGRDEIRRNKINYGFNLTKYFIAQFQSKRREDVQACEKELVNEKEIPMPEQQMNLFFLEHTDPKIDLFIQEMQDKDQKSKYTFDVQGTTKGNQQPKGY